MTTATLSHRAASRARGGYGFRTAAQMELNRLAFNDPLTNLPNRQFFLERLEQALGRATRQQRPIAVLFVDLDNFKLINDSLGHPEGDRLLREVARRLSACVGAAVAGGTVARFGGDEFTVLVEDTAAVAGDLAEQLAAVLRAPVVLKARDVFGAANAAEAATRLQHCAQRFEDYSEQVIDALHAPEPSLGADAS